MGKNLGAGLVGVVIAMLSVWLIQKIGHAVYPPSADIDPNDIEAMKAYVATLPIGALLFVVASYFIGTMVGTCVACAIGTMLPRIYALLIGCLMLVATTMNVMMIPHPTWFILAAVIAIVAGAWLGTMCKRAIVGNDA
ncbi:MAG: hypothetical protein KC572_10075 [Gammaproteobacteria bacterium]|nr:hypothetical protein [Gammaproteobacteria bacterium]